MIKGLSHQEDIAILSIFEHDNEISNHEAKVKRNKGRNRHNHNSWRLLTHLSCNKINK